MFNTVQKVSSVDFFKKNFPVPQELQERKLAFDELIKANLISKERYVVLVGPCSADSVESVTKYLKLLKMVSDEVSDKILIAARIFSSKPRTDGEGYLGFAFHQNEDEAVDFNKGIANVRQLMQNCIEIGFPVADELLYPELSEYFNDLVSYQFLGARSSLDPLHRDIASGLNIAVGVKNSIDGDLLAVVKSVYAIQKSKVFLQNGNQIETSGNKFAHIVLRGFHDGRSFRKNCDRKSTKKAVKLADDFGLATPFLMVDCSHANSKKIAVNQISNALKVVSDRNVNGVILESYLEGGVSPTVCGVSKTDDCLDFETTKKLIFELYKRLK